MSARTSAAASVARTCATPTRWTTPPEGETRRVARVASDVSGGGPGALPSATSAAAFSVDDAARVLDVADARAIRRRRPALLNERHARGGGARCAAVVAMVGGRGAALRPLAAFALSVGSRRTCFLGPRQPSTTTRALLGRRGASCRWRPRRVSRRRSRRAVRRADARTRRSRRGGRRVGPRRRGRRRARVGTRR